ncbi:alpha-amylase family protein [Rhodobacter ferrooxidans]|uniref:Alpha amylase catalytic region n=1 Tax=Rhodobacter ferrooxidans TaxID=371731 RepID=C8RXB5_9RHOB|nr:alpha-amylase family protein [Rhodobacter sp. SW2]EEW26640.1 alpha amylase catalytic region [Rhodobacter sp. SW2]
MAKMAAVDEIFDLRLARSAPDLWPMLDALFGHRADYPTFRDALLGALRAAWEARPADLRHLDLQRDLEPDWFQRSDRAGYVFYIDRFAGTLPGILEKLDYLQDLGITYVHLMPCLKPRPGDSDGGYSVMDYRAINPAFGTMEDFEATAKALRARGISLCIDLVLNHTAKEHDWAQKARNGDPKYQDYYLMFDDDSLPKRFERTLVEVFPDNAPGSFTHYPEFGKWVWTTFNEHQWDLNWANPQVFLEMVGIMLNLANRGVDVVRLDAVAFMWKRLGTRCQSEPEVHMLLQALRACSRIAAPAVIHLEEAIVAPAEMLPYLGRGRHDGREGNLAYHNSLMVQFWSALATRDTRLMTHVLRSHFPATLNNATYATYIRCHDDIGWAITDEDANALGISGGAHRTYLSDFYEGSFPGSFARGALFQVNQTTGDKRISGTFASLAGLEKAMAMGDAAGVEVAIQRILLGHALIAAYGGIPLIYMGDELAMLNDHGYLDQPDHAHDSRWIHRPMMDWTVAATRETADTPAAKVFRGTRHILTRRRATPALHGASPTEVLDCGLPGVFAVARRAPAGTVLCLFNFADDWRHLPESFARAKGVTRLHDALSDQPVVPYGGLIALPPQARVWLT